MPANTVVENEKRRLSRVSLPLSCKVESHVDKKASWSEITRLADVSAFGAGFPLGRPIKQGQLVLLTTSMPRQLRCYDFTEPQYRVWGLVLRCVPVRTSGTERSYMIGVAFVGKNPPSGYLENPTLLYEIAHHGADGLWSVVEASKKDDPRVDPRRQTRLSIPEAVTIELLDDQGNIVASETTVTENISLGGAAVFSTLNTNAGALVRVTSERCSTKIMSVVRCRRSGPDGLPRLHLEFIDNSFPLEGLG